MRALLPLPTGVDVFDEASAPILDQWYQANLREARARGEIPSEPEPVDQHEVVVEGGGPLTPTEPPAPLPGAPAIGTPASPSPAPAPVTPTGAPAGSVVGKQFSNGVPDTFKGRLEAGISQSPVWGKPSTDEGPGISIEPATPTTPSKPYEPLPSTIADQEATAAGLNKTNTSPETGLKGLFDITEHVTDDLHTAESLSMLTRHLSPADRRETLDWFKNSGYSPEFMQILGSSLQGMEPHDLRVALWAFKNTFDATQDADKSWNNMLSVVRDNLGNANPNVLQIATVASAVGSGGLGGFIRGRAMAGLKEAGLATASIVAGQAAEAALPNSTPDWVRKVVTTAASTTPFTLPSQGVKTGLLTAVGGAVAQEGYERSGLPLGPEIPGVGHPGPLAANLAGIIATGAVTHTLAERNVKEVQSPEEAAAGRYRLEVPKLGSLEYSHTTQGADITHLDVDKPGRTSGALLQRAVTDIRARNPDAVITADLNTPGAVSMFLDAPGGIYYDSSGRPIAPIEAARLAVQGEASRVELHPGRTPSFDAALGALHGEQGPVVIDAREFAPVPAADNGHSGFRGAFLEGLAWPDRAQAPESPVFSGLYAGVPIPSRSPWSRLSVLGGRPVVAPRDLADYVGDVKAGVAKTPWLGSLLSKLGINPSAAATDPISQATLAVARQRAEAEFQIELSMKAIVDHYNQHATGFDRLFDHAGDDKAILRVVDRATGAKVDVPWNDVYQKPRDFVLTERQMDAIADAQVYVRELEAIREAHGLNQFGPRFDESAYGYMPRQVKTIRGIETQRASSTKFQRHYETAAEGNRAGVLYAGVRDTLALHGRATLREVMDKQLSDFLKTYSIAPSRLVPTSLVDGLRDAVKARLAVEADLRSLGRARVRLQTAGAEAAAIKEVRQMRFSAISDLRDAIKQLASDVSQAVRTRDSLRDGRMPEPLIEQAEEHLKTTREALSELRDYRNQVIAGHQVLGEPIAGAALKFRRGERAQALLENRAKQGNLQGRLEQALKAEAQALRDYRTARLNAENANQADAGLFPQSAATGEIPIAKWGKRFFPSGDAAKLKASLDRLVGEPPHIALAAFNSVANAMRFLAAGLDWGLGFTHGLVTMFNDPKAWGRGQANQIAASFDPVLQADYIRRELSSLQEMVRAGVPAGGNDLFSHERGLFGDVVGKARLSPTWSTAAKVFDAISKQTYGRAEVSYNLGLLTYRNELWKGMRTTYAGQEMELGRLIRNMTGGLDSAALGVSPSQRSIEAMWLAFSPRLLRSTMALMSDAVRGASGGALKPGAQRGSLLAMSRVMVGTVGLYALTGLALQRAGADISTDEIVEGLNPLSGKRFLSFRIGDGWYGIGGNIRAFAQLAANIGAHYDDPAAFTYWSQENPLVAYWTQRGAPGFNLASGLAGAASGGSLQINPYANVSNWGELALFVGQNSLPFALAQWAKDGDQGQWPAAASVFGLRTSTASPSDQLTSTRLEAMHSLAASADIVGELSKYGVKLDPTSAASLQAALKVMTYNELGAGTQRIIDKMVTAKDPSLKKEYEDARRERGSVYQQVADQAEKVREKYAHGSGSQGEVTYDQLWKALQEGGDPKAIQESLKLLRAKEQGAISELYGRPGDKNNNALAAEYQAAIAKLEPTDLRKWEDEWHAIPSKYVAAEGGIDWDKVDAARVAFMGKLDQFDPDLATLLATDLDMADQLSKAGRPEILQFKALVDQQLSPYYQIDKQANLSASQKASTKENWLAANPQANALYWMMSGVTLHSSQAAKIALDFGLNRTGNDKNDDPMGVRLSGSKFVFTKANRNLLDTYSSQIDSLLSPAQIQIGRQVVRQSTLLRMQSPLMDALNFLLEFEPPETQGLYKATVAVYHDPTPFLRQWGLSRPDGARWRPVAPR